MTPISIGIGWDLAKNKKVDLDATIVMINDVGQIEDAVYYN